MCGLSSLLMDSWLMGASSLFRQNRLYVGVGSCVSHESGRLMVGVGGAGGGGVVAVFAGSGVFGGVWEVVWLCWLLVGVVLVNL